jgi:hypothetical protein
LVDSFRLAIILSPDLDKVKQKGKPASKETEQRSRDARSEQKLESRIADTKPELRSEDLATLQTQLGLFL